MDITAATNFDRLRDYSAYWSADPVGAAAWLVAVANAADLRCEALAPVRGMFHQRPALDQEAALKESLLPSEALLLAMGDVVSAPPGQLDPRRVADIGWASPAQLQPPLLTGQIRVEPATEAMRAVTREVKALSIRRPLEKMLTLESGGVKGGLVCANDPLESLAADLSVFEGAHSVSVRAWPDTSGRLFVEECAPVVKLPGLEVSDFASGRLYSPPDRPDAVALRVDRTRLLSIPDAAVRAQLRPFVGTGVILYGKRRVDVATGSVSLEEVAADCWILCRLTDPKDDAAKLEQAPLPSIQGDRCLCIGATPPWNWSGPNVRTHILAPIHVASLVRTTERRLVFGRVLRELPGDVVNPLPEVKRVFEASAVTERDTDNEAHWSTRLGPVGPIVRDLSGIAFLTSAVTVAGG